MKKILLFISLSFAFSQTVQAQEKIYFTAPVMEVVIMEDNQIGLRKPFGKNIELELDNFFKTIYFTFYDENATYSSFELSFLTDIGSVGEDQVWRMYDKNNNTFIVTNQIKTKGRLVLAVENTLKSERPTYFWMEEVKRK